MEMIDKMTGKQRRRNQRLIMGIVGGVLLSSLLTMLIVPKFRRRAFAMVGRRREMGDEMGGSGVRGAGEDFGHARRRASRARRHAADTFDKDASSKEGLRREVNILESDMDRSFDI